MTIFLSENRKTLRTRPRAL